MNDIISNHTACETDDPGEPRNALPGTVSGSSPLLPTGNYAEVFEIMLT